MTHILCRGEKITLDQFIFIAGHCSIESEDNIYANAKEIAKCGVKFLRGGAFKPRTSPYSFQGIGKEATVWLDGAAKENNMYFSYRNYGHISVGIIS